MGELRTPEECAVFARCGIAVVRNAIKNGELNHVRVGRRKMVTVSSLEAWCSPKPTLPRVEKATKK